MILVQPESGSAPADLVLRACGRGPALLVCVAPGPPPGRCEPFATFSEVVGDELPLVVVDGWTPAAWARGVAALADELRLSPDQARRAATQTLDEHRVEVLFVEHGQVQGSALTVIATRDERLPVGLNVKVTIMDLLVAAREAGLSGLSELCVLARQALGIPAGPTGKVRRTLRSAPPLTGPVGPKPIPVSAVRPPPPKPPAPKETPAERHALEGGRCTRCGKSGKDLDGPCGRPELGRMGVIELD